MVVVALVFASSTRGKFAGQKSRHEMNLIFCTFHSSILPTLAFTYIQLVRQLWT